MPTTKTDPVIEKLKTDYPHIFKCALNGESVWLSESDGLELLEDISHSLEEYGKVRYEEGKNDGRADESIGCHEHCEMAVAVYKKKLAEEVKNLPDTYEDEESKVFKTTKAEVLSLINH